MSYVFDIETLHAIARQGRGKAHDEMVRIVVEEAARAYPAHIDANPRRRWLFSPTSGVTGVMTLLHASFSEYLIIFGTPVGTEGFSGRYRMDIHDSLLVGEIWTYRHDHCAGCARWFVLATISCLNEATPMGSRYRKVPWRIVPGLY